jgi:uncharacterized membrane protein
MLRYLAAYGASAVAFLAMDFCWLSFATERVYRPAMGDMLAAKVSLVPGALFYLIYLGGVLFLAVAPALKSGGWTKAAASAAVLGLVAYATYDLTNQATLRNWSTKLTLLDMGWGVVVTTVAALAAFWAARAFGPEPS